MSAKQDRELRNKLALLVIFTNQTQREQKEIKAKQQQKERQQ